nr:RnfABCDGE type electron transport complex subunit B [Piscirickettsia litoralis]
MTMKAVSIEAIEALLPQTQCTRCGYPDCNAYAKAVAAGTAHNQCPPGGPETIIKLSELLDREVKVLNPKKRSARP